MHKYLISRVTGAASCRPRPGAVRADHPDARHRAGLANGGLILFGSQPVSVQTPLSRESWEIGLVFLNQARTVGFVSRSCSLGLYLPHPHQSRQGAARGRRQSDRRGLRGVDVDRSHRIAFGLGVGITAVAGGLIASSQSFQP